MLLRLTNQAARAAARKAVDEAPAGHVVRIGEPTRSLEANARLHALIAEIAETREWAGGRQDPETWKRLLVAAWMRATDRKVTLMPALDGHGVDAIYQRTSKLSVSECNELMDFVEAWHAQDA